ncbi:MAG TPA: type II toxin-antitoxin system PemK/MazF family toxin [Fimbriiglobus sp.]|nr:type II toxin-antitoxin system PemK/MazF family toxin [Fimbriiglobus sp.]
MQPEQGEIYDAWAGGETWRPVLVVSRRELNGGRYVVAVPFTSAQFDKRRDLPNCVPFAAGDCGLTKDCVAQADAISVIPIDQINLEQGPIGRVSDEQLRDVILAIQYVIAAEDF